MGAVRVPGQGSVTDGCHCGRLAVAGDPHGAGKLAPLGPRHRQRDWEARPVSPGWAAAFPSGPRAPLAPSF